MYFFVMTTKQALDSKLYIFEPQNWQKGMNPVPRPKSQYTNPKNPPTKTQKINFPSWDDKSIRPRTANASIFGNNPNQIKKLLDNENGLAARTIYLSSYSKSPSKKSNLILIKKLQILKDTSLKELLWSKWVLQFIQKYKNRLEIVITIKK